MAQQIKHLARIAPGMAGYQDLEAVRDTDRMIRLRLASDLRECTRDLEAVKRRLMEMKDLSLLPWLDYLRAKVDKLSNVMRYAGQGDRGFLDPYPVDREKLERLYAFDLRLFDEVQAVREQVRALAQTGGNPPKIKEAIPTLDGALDQLERIFSTRCNILTIH